jgi:hypothetical protein
MALAEIQKRCEQLAERAGQLQAVEVVQLPLWPYGRRGSPNSFLRSALFAAIQGKDRSFIKDTTLFSQQGISVKFTGERLNQEDMTIWLALIDLAHYLPLGSECLVTSYAILKHMGIGDGGRERERLRLSIERMTACMVKIKTGRYTYGGSLIEEFTADEDTRSYKLRLNYKLINLFGKDDWTGLCWEQRKALRNKPLALKLHEYYSSHERPFAVTVDFLHKVTGSGSNDPYGFKRKINAALDELVRVGFLASYTVEGQAVTVSRA